MIRISEINISLKQLIFLIIVFLIADTAYFAFVYKISRHDTWLVHLVSMSFGILLLFLINFIYKRTQAGILDILILSFGKVVGKFLGILYILYFLFLLSLTISNIGRFTNDLILYDQKISIVYAAIIIACGYAAFIGLESIVRANYIVTFVGIVSLVLFFILSLFELNIKNLLPILTYKAGPILHGIKIESAAPYGQIIILIVLLPFVKSNVKELYKISFSLIAVAIVTIVIFFDIIGVLSVEMSSNLTHVTVQTLKVTKIGMFIQHSDIFAILMDLSLQFIKISLLYYVVIILMSNYFGLKNKNSLVIPIGVLIFAMSSNMYENDIEKFKLITEVLPIISIPLQYIIPIMIGIILLFKKPSIQKIPIK